MARYKEIFVSPGPGIAAILTLPCQLDKRVPAVLLLHGFASHKDEVGGMFKRLTASLTEFGIASLRIDFRGWGESANDANPMADSTVGGMLDDATLAYDFLAARPEVDPARIGVLGFSLGGGVAVLSTARREVAALALWSPAGDLTADFTRLRSDAAPDQPMAPQSDPDALVTLDLGWRVVQLRERFFMGLAQHDLQAIIRGYRGPFLAIAGTNDFSAAHVERYMENTASLNKQPMILISADHIFSVLDTDQRLSQLVIDRTAAWFAAALYVEAHS